MKAQEFTAAQAAFVLGEPVRAVKKALDAGPVRAEVRHSKGRTPVRVIKWPDLFYLYAARELREELTPKARAKLYEAITSKPVRRRGAVHFGRLVVPVAGLFDEVEKRTKALAALANEVEFREDGEPRLKRTGIEVYRIAALLEGGLSVDDVLADYPSLSKSAVKTAKAYASAYPKSGRPYPGTTAKRALRGAGLEALDGLLEGNDSDE